MRTAARVFATMAVSMVMTAAVYGDETVTPKPKASTDEIALSGTAPLATARLDTSAVSRPAAPPRKHEGHAGPQPAGKMHRRQGSGNGTPKVELFLGYSFWRAMPTSQSNRMGYLHGGSTSVAYNFNNYLGLVADFGGYANSKVTLFSPAGSQTLDSNGRAYTYVFGPRLSYRGYERFTPFVQALFGGTHATAVTISGCTGDPSCTPLGSENAFAMMLGTGVDIKLTKHFSWRLVEGDYLLTRFKDPFSSTVDERGWQKNVRLSSGLVVRFGGNPEPLRAEPMAATCVADHEMVYAGSGDVVAVRVETSSSDKYPLNYSWSASEGSIDGTGPEARWKSAERHVGAYIVRVRVDNGRNGSAECFANIRVEPRPNRAPTLTCSAERREVTVGDMVEITASASDADDDHLTFTWNASGGRVRGSEAQVKFETAKLAPGPYTVTGRVDDGRSGTADCQVIVEVKAVQVPAEVRELETRLALHSIYFQTARPTIANPGGGLVESQEKVLLSLAKDFARYLTFRPQAHLILEGHADRRGSEEYNKALTERRVGRTKSFLMEHGVPGENIETRAMGKQENLDAEQVKQLIESNPELSAEERQRLEKNLQVIVLANNRRVDISLNTTGQQSVRQYPFNAKDSLTLLSPSGGEHAKAARARARRKTAKP